jgi:RHS repeat-associated protein
MNVVLGREPVRPVLALLWLITLIAVGAAGIPRSAQAADSPPTNDPGAGTIAGTADAEGGAATYTMPIEVPPGRAGMQPSLALVYNSRSGDGVMGLGWTIAGLSSIHRCPQTPAQDGATLGVSYTNADRLCLDGQRLVVVSGTYGAANAQYHTEIDSYARITQMGGDLTSTSTWFKVEEKSGRIGYYGQTAEPANPSRCDTSTPHAHVQPAGAPAPLSWLVERIEDRVGNNMLYGYANCSNGEVLPYKITYTGFVSPSAVGDRTVTFTYATRPGTVSDLASSYLAGGLTMQTQELQSIVTAVGGTAVRTYTPTYQAAIYNKRLLMASLKECAGAYCRPATTFSYNDGSLVAPYQSLGNLSLPALTGSGDYYDVTTAGDFDGDGTREAIVTALQNGIGTHEYLVQFTADRTMQGKLELTGTPFGASTSLDADIDGSGRTFLVQLPSSSGFLQLVFWNLASFPRGTVPATNPFVTVPTNISFNPTQATHATGRRVYAADVNGDGKTDIVVVAPLLSTSSACPGVAAGTQDAVFVYLNKITSALSSTSVTASFSPLNGTDPLFCLPRSPTGFGSYVYTWIDHIADFDGNGLPDFYLNYPAPTSFQGNVAGVARTQRNGTAISGSISTCSALGLTTDDCQWSASYAAQWMDINGDGLEDLVIAKPGSTWRVHLNQGNGQFGAEIDTTSSEGMQTVTGINAFRYAGKLPSIDIDGDGRPELLTPSTTQGMQGFALKTCSVKAVPINQSTGECPHGTINVNSTDAVQCPAYSCPQNPGDNADNMPANPDTQPGFPYVWNGLPGFRTYDSNTAHGGVGTDFSVYHLAALKFVQTGATSFRVDRIETPLIAHLRGAPGHSDDLFGDGLADLVGAIGCPNATIDGNVGQGSEWHYPVCSAVDDGTWGPTSLPDGTAASFFANHVVLYANLNQGLSSPGGSPGTPSIAAALRPPLPTVDSVGTGTSFGLSLPILPGVLDAAKNGLGDFASWGYLPLAARVHQGSNLPLYQFAGTSGYVDSDYYYFTSSMPAVFGMTQNTGNSGSRGFRSAYFGYSEAMYNHLGRGFQGFRTITRNTLATTADSARQLRVTTTYNQKFPLAGKVAEVDTRAPDTGVQIRDEIDTWGCTLSNRNTPCSTVEGQASVVQPFLNEQFVQNYDLATGAAVSHVDTVNAVGPGATASGWDAYGNLAHQWVSSSDDAAPVFVSSRTVTTTNTYTYDTANWFVDKLGTSSVTTGIQYTSSHSSPVTIPSRTLTTTYVWNTDRTPQSQTVQWNSQQRTTAWTYGAPSYGLPKDVTISGTDVSPAQRKTQFTYTKNGTTSAADGYFVLTTTNPAGHPTTTQHATSDGQVTVTTDSNALVTTNAYDAFGHLAGITYLDASGATLLPPVSIGYGRCTSGACTGVGENDNESTAAYRITRVQSGTPTTVDWYDVLGRAVKHVERGFDGTFAETVTDYDNFNTVADTSTPFFQGVAVPYFTAWNYDRLNRPTQKLAPGSELDSHGDVLTTYTYSGNKTTIKVKASGVSSTCSPSTNLCMDMSRTYDVLGQLEQTTQGNGSLPNYATTNYWYDGAGNTVAIKDTEGNLISAAYDDAGHRTQLTDPDAGSRTFQYDGLGELLMQTDARSVETDFGYDALGRLIQRKAKDANAVAPTPKLIQDTWSYDPSGSNGGQGLLGSAKRQTSANVNGPLGTAIWQETEQYEPYTKRLHSQATTAEGLSWTIAYTYDTNGREQTVAYPDLTVRKGYATYGDLDELDDDATGNVYWNATAKDAWGNLTGETYGSNLTGAHQSYASTGQSKTKKWTSGAAVLDQWTYTYDSFGNLKTQGRAFNGAGTTSDTFGYDGVQRLTQDSRTGIPGGNPPAVSYAYSASGNLTSKSDNPGTYSYDGNGCGPHAVSQVGATTYFCDANGNVTGGNTLTASYDFNDQPWQVSRSSAGMAQFEYTPDGAVFKESASSHTTWFGSHGYEASLVGSTPVERYELGPALVVRQGGTNAVEAVLRDRLGSQVALLTVGTGGGGGTVPGTPTLSVSPNPSLDGAYTVSWSSVSGATSYLLQEQGPGNATWQTVPNISGTSHGFSGRFPGLYQYQVQACSDTQCGAFSVAVQEEVDPPPPSAPGASPNPSNTGSYTVTWNSVSGAQAYQLEESVNHSGSWTSVTGLTTQLNWSTTGRTEGTYSYRVRACVTQCGNPSGVTDEVVTTGGGSTPPKPTLSVDHNPSVTGNYTLSWTHNGGPTYFMLTQVGGQTWQVEDPIYSQSFTGMPNGSYTYYIQACNANGCGHASDSLTEQVTIAGPGYPAWVHVSPNPSLDGSYTVSWASVSGLAVTYVLEEATSDQPGVWTPLFTQSTTSHLFTGKPDGYYGYRVKACAAGACGIYTNSPTEIVKNTPPVPTNVHVTPQTSTGTFTVSWDAMPTATWYQVYESENGNPPAAVNTYLLATSLSLTRGNGTYAYQVEACNQVPVIGTIRCSDMSPVTAAATETVSGSTLPPMPASIWVSNPCTAQGGHCLTAACFQPGCTQYTIAWDTVPGADHYVLHEVVEEDGDTWDGTYTQAAGDTQHAVLTPRHAGPEPYPEVTYHYSVKACTSGGLCSELRGTATVLIGHNVQIESLGIVAASAYDAFGKTRNEVFTDRTNGTLGELPDTLRGFTGQMHADDVRLIHMGGRVYDYQLGRFLSVDPIIGNLASSQSLNPYSYIGNNPLSGTDPTGYDCQQDSSGKVESSCLMSNDGINKITNTDGKTVATVIVVSKGDTIQISSNGANVLATFTGKAGDISRALNGSSSADIGSIGKNTNGTLDGTVGWNALAPDRTYTTVDTFAQQQEAQRQADFAAYRQWTFAHEGLEPVAVHPFEAAAQNALGVYNEVRETGGLSVETAGTLAVSAMVGMMGVPVVGTAPKSVFHEAASTLSETGQQNIRTLRGWAESKGWSRKPGNGPERWGIPGENGFEWRLKIKPVVGARSGLEAGSQKPRFDARLDEKSYINPFTGETGGREVGTHLPLEQEWK